MDEYATPIDQIRNDIAPPDLIRNQPHDSPAANYSDLLQTMESHQQAPQQMQQQVAQNDFPPHPIVQSNMPINRGMNPNFMSSNTTHTKQDSENMSNMSQLQKDFMFIVVPSLVLYSSTVQNHLLRVLPSLFKDDKPSIVGNIANAAVIAFVFLALKNMKINFS